MLLNMTSSVIHVWTFIVLSIDLLCIIILFAPWLMLVCLDYSSPSSLKPPSNTNNSEEDFDDFDPRGSNGKIFYLFGGYTTSSLGMPLAY